MKPFVVLLFAATALAQTSCPVKFWGRLRAELQEHLITVPQLRR